MKTYKEFKETNNLGESFFDRIKSIPEIIAATKAANSGDIEGMKHHAKKYAEKQSSDINKHAELQKKIYSQLAQKSTHPAARAVAKSLSESYESDNEEVELKEGFMDNVVKPLALTAAIAGATGVGSHFDKTHPSQFTADNTRYTIAHNPQDAQGRDAQKKTLNGKPHLVWQHKGQTFALPVNEETEIDEGASSILRAKHYLRVAEPRAKSDAIIAQAKGDKEAEAKANKRLSFTQHVRNKMDFPKLAVESSNPETYAQHLDHHVTTTEPTTANIIKMHDIINSAVKAGGSADHLYNQVAGNQFAHQKYRTAAS